MISLKDGTSTSEKTFLLGVLKEHRRIDGRSFNDARNVDISFGKDFGCCVASLGNTRVMCQVTCQVKAPKATRPNEGFLFINVDFPLMSSILLLDNDQLLQTRTELVRLLERCYKEARVVDMESLCIVGEEKVWELRVDISIMCDDGGMIDCASIAALSALCHFRRPDVTLEGEEVTIHSIKSRDPIKLSIHHMPILVSFSFYENGKFVLMDPDQREQKGSEGLMVVGANPFRELCTLHRTGSVPLIKDQVRRCAEMVALRARSLVGYIKKELEKDGALRSKREHAGFAAHLPRSLMVKPPVEVIDVERETRDIPMRDIVQRVSAKRTGNEVENMSIEVGKWDVPKGTKDESDFDESSASSDVEMVQQVTAEEKKTVEEISIMSDSEEDEVVALGAADLGFQRQKPKPKEKIGKPADSQALQELSKDKPSLKQVDGHAATFLKTLGNVDKELGKQINYLTQVSTGQPHEGSSYAAQKVLQMALHRLEHARSRVNESERIRASHMQQLINAGFISRPQSQQMQQATQPGTPAVQPQTPQQQPQM
ncbi:unnamed protein product [Darwinula stevensoni]|uniref:Mediator of RNA polymerase II transcription subunit 11 n=1 Tax=Darwinula stevensoni TaxID=69355 RepID=A0A7R8X4A6_9CRUS|nr:unnamed protein product [Darwinula stevensoni]CAG0883470.1 unnamed protein product [Darwinula stevensoni]